MTKEQIWDIACRETLKQISDSYSKFPKRLTGKATIDKMIKGFYNSLSKDVLKIPIPEMPIIFEDYEL